MLLKEWLRLEMSLLRSHMLHREMMNILVLQVHNTVWYTKTIQHISWQMTEKYVVRAFIISSKYRVPLPGDEGDLRTKLSNQPHDSYDDYYNGITNNFLVKQKQNTEYYY